MKKTILIMLTAISTSATAMAQTAATTDEQAIQKIISSMESNWVQKNGAGFATVFADQHDFIVWNGYYFPNQSRENNARAHQGLFDGPYRTYDIKLKIDKIRFIRPDLALVHVLGAGYQKGTPVPENPGVLMSLIMEKKEGNWKIISFHNLNLEAFENKEMEKNSPMPLKVMYANWYKK